MTAATTTATVASVRSYLLDLQARITIAIAAIEIGAEKPTVRETQAYK